MTYQKGPFHAGPVQAYLSRAPDGSTLKDYDGSGRWFKFGSIGLNPKNSSVDWLGSSQWRKVSLSRNSWLSGRRNSYLTPDVDIHSQEAIIPSFTIPKKTPRGQYLLRIESSYPRALPNYAQFYVACAHIDVKGSGGGKLLSFYCGLP